MYSVPREAEKVFLNGIIKNPLIKDGLPAETDDLRGKIVFQGSDSPSVPINWRFAESISALKALEALFVNALLVKKYNTAPKEIIVDT